MGAIRWPSVADKMGGPEWKITTPMEAAPFASGLQLHELHR